MQAMPCVVCRNPATVASHILPRAMMRMVCGDSPFLLQGRRDRDGRQRSQSGDYDEDLLCDRHERMLGAADRYGVGLWRSVKRRIAAAPCAFRWTVPNPEPDLLALFIMSVVWRFAQSKFGRDAPFTLGPYEASLRARIFSGEPAGHEPAIVVAVAEQRVGAQAVEVVHAPHWARIGHEIWWRFHVGGVEFWMKLGKRTSVLPAADFANGRDPLTIKRLPAPDLRESTEVREIFTRMARSAGPPMSLPGASQTE